MLGARSLMKSRNYKGPRTEPWGTPDFTGNGSEDAPSTTTFCVLLLLPSKNDIHPCMFPRIPYPATLDSKRRVLRCQRPLRSPIPACPPVHYRLPLKPDHGTLVGVVSHMNAAFEIHAEHQSRCCAYPGDPGCAC